MHRRTNGQNKKKFLIIRNINGEILNQKTIFLKIPSFFCLKFKNLTVYLYVYQHTKMDK